MGEYSARGWQYWPNRSSKTFLTCIHTSCADLCVRVSTKFRYTVFIRIVAAATINFAPSSVRLLFEGGYYLFRVRAMIDTAVRIRYVYICTYAEQRPPDEFIACAATIRGRLLFFCASAMCGYYSRAATIRCAAIIRINTVLWLYNVMLFYISTRVHVHSLYIL